MTSSEEVKQTTSIDQDLCELMYGLLLNKSHDSYEKLF